LATQGKISLLKNCYKEKQIMCNKFSVPLWRDKPSDFKLLKEQNKLDINTIFPSARQALYFSLLKLSLTRKNRVALPEWSSCCLINTVGKLAAPIPINEVYNYNIPVKAVIIYDQWGWPVTDNAWDMILDRFRKVHIVSDKVDTLFTSNRPAPKSESWIEIYSLSKTLGLAGGGISIINGNPLSLAFHKHSEALNNHIWSNKVDPNIQPVLLNFSKNDIHFVPHSVKTWLLKNDIKKAIDHEGECRRSNINVFMQHTELVDGWEKWMFDAINEKHQTPGIIPIFRNKSKDYLLKVQSHLTYNFGLETCIFHFNFSGNPLIPMYDDCLAFPVHGQANNLIQELNSKSFAF